MKQEHFVDQQIRKLIEDARRNNPKLAKYLEEHIIISEEGICFKGEESTNK